MSQASTPSRTNINLLVHGLIAVAITLFLFYIDEGYYNFKWTQSLANWIWFVFYSGGLFTGQVLVRFLFFRNFTGWPYTMMTSVLGSMIGLAMVIGLLSLPRLLSQLQS